MKRVFSITLIVLFGVALVSASTFQRFDAPLRWSPAISAMMSEYEDGASAVTIVPPDDDDDDWTVIFIYPNENEPEWI